MVEEEKEEEEEILQFLDTIIGTVLGGNQQ
jgi:hypothetical protein